MYLPIRCECCYGDNCKIWPRRRGGEGIKEENIYYANNWKGRKNGKHFIAVTSGKQVDRWCSGKDVLVSHSCFVFIFHQMAMWIKFENSISIRTPFALNWTHTFKHCSICLNFAFATGLLWSATSEKFSQMCHFENTDWFGDFKIQVLADAHLASLWLCRPLQSQPNFEVEKEEPKGKIITNALPNRTQ